MLSTEMLIEFLDADLGVDVDGSMPTRPLFSSQLVDSFALVTLMMFLQREAGIRIAPADVNLDNMTPSAGCWPMSRGSLPDGRLARLCRAPAGNAALCL